MDSKKTKVEEFTLEKDSELRFEIETKNRKVVVEVSYFKNHITLNFIVFNNIVFIFFFILAKIRTSRIIWN